MSARGLLFGLCIALVVTGCAAEPSSAPLRDPALSRSRFNQVSCAHCHDVGDGVGERLLPGASLQGVLTRTQFWGGAFDSAKSAANECFTHFMRGEPLAQEPEAERALLRSLTVLSPPSASPSESFAWTLERAPQAPAGGDAARGATLYARACVSCHGEAHTGLGRLALAPVLPEDTERTHTAARGYTDETLRQTFAYKIRLGSYDGLAGTMPPFSLEALSRADVADLVAFLAPVLR
ncbi:MAG: c-type cytochrome [Deltaproteobacteria bacterium]|nr:c-type cytochrome [Deltaproteobacteria bacterium]